MVAIAVAGTAWGQTEAISNFNPLNAKQGAGVHLLGVSVFSGYYTAGSPASFEVPSSNAVLGQTASLGTAITLGGTKSAEKSRLSWSYSPSYFRLLYSEQSRQNNGSLNHRASVNGSWELGKRLTLTASTSGVVASFQQLYFSPSVLGNVAAMPTTFDDLALGIMRGKFTDAQLATALTGTRLQASPEQAYLYGTRLLNISAAVGVSWAMSGRSSLAFSLSGTRSQHFNGIEEPVADGHTNPVLPQLTTTAASVSWSYSVSPRTQIGISASAARTFSSVQRGYSPEGAFSIGRTLSHRWFLQGRVGVGVLTYSRQTYATPAPVQYTYGGTAGFKTSAHTFLASCDRSLGDAYGLGSDSTGTATGAWNWRRPGSQWSISGSGGYQDLHNQTFQNTRSWRAGTGVARALRQHVSFSVQYIYFEMPANFQTVGVKTSEHGATISLTWSPSQYQ